MRQLLRVTIAGVLLAIAVPTTAPADPVPLFPGTLLRGTVVTMDAAHTVIPNGNVLVRQGLIEAIWSGGRPPRGVSLQNVRVVSAGPDGLIFPGLINLHDHPGWGVLPLWLPPSSHAQLGRPTGTEPYANRYQWGDEGKRSPQYEALVSGPGSTFHSKPEIDDVLTYTEVRAALGGTTAIEGADNIALPIRNVDGQNFGGDDEAVDDWVKPSVTEMTDAKAWLIKQEMLDGDLETWLVHLAEGVDASSRAELDAIEEDGLLTDATVVVHGTALEREDFEDMRAAPPAARIGRGDGLGAKLVWSPLSNLLLYGETTEVYDALAEDVTVSLGTDWSPSGSNTLLDELKVADIALRHQHLLGDSRGTVPALADDALLDRTLVDMVTRNPAQALRWSEVGTIAPGKVADLLLLRRPTRAPTGGMPDSPYRSLIDATSRDVVLTLVGGVAIAGDISPMATLRGSDYEVVKSPTMRRGKAVDVTPPGGGESLSVITTRLRNMLQLLGGPLGPIQLRPLFTTDDDFLFAVLAPHIARGGLINDPTPPYDLYAANLNFMKPGGSPFAPAAFFERWYG